MSRASPTVRPPAPIPRAVTVVNENGASAYVLVCEHASNFIPPDYADLGLPPWELTRHIAWDIGAGSLASQLSRRLDAPLFLAGHSRLLIDCNRPLAAPSSIPTRSEATDIPGNHGLDEDERQRRAAAYFTPFHARITEFLDRRVAAGRPAIVVGVHSFTPVFLGVRRPWQAGVLYGRASALGQALIAGLAAEAGLQVGENEPYRITADEDYTVPVHGDQRGIDAVLLEVRQDLLAAAGGPEEWASRLTAAMSAVAPQHSTAVEAGATPAHQV